MKSTRVKLLMIDSLLVELLNYLAERWPLYSMIAPERSHCKPLSSVYFISQVEQNISLKITGNKHGDGDENTIEAMPSYSLLRPTIYYVVLCLWLRTF